MMINLIPQKYRFMLAGATLIAFVLMSAYIAYLSSRLDTVKLQRDQSKQQLQYCVKQHVINQEVSREYQSKLGSITARVSDLKRMLNTQCVPLSAARPDGAAENGAVERNGVDAGALLDYAGRCEGLKQQVLGLQSYIKRSAE